MNKKQTKKKRIITFIITSAVAISLPTKCLAIEDAIIAVVNDELITLKDLKDYIQSTYVSLVAEGVSNTEIQNIMSDMEINGTKKLIEDKLILSKANEVGIVVREGLIDERIEELKEKYGTEQKLVDALIKSGATLTDLRDKIQDQLKIKYIIDHAVKSDIYVNPQEVTQYYEENKNQFMQDERIKLDSIFIAYGSDKFAALENAVEAFSYATVSANNFTELFDEYSDAPSVGIIKKGQLLPLIEEVVFNLKMNEVSHLVEVDNGIYIFKLVDEMSAEIVDMKEVQDSIYDQLYMKKFKSEFMVWLDNLKKDAYIEIKQ